MEISERVNVFGWSAKVITLPAKQNQEIYRLSDQQRLGLPEGSMVVGFLVRANLFLGLDYEKSINNRLLIHTDVVRASYLNLKGWGETTILADANLFNFHRNVGTFGFGFGTTEYQPFIKPISVDKISWNKSYIRISGDTARNVITGNEDIEFIVLYKSKEAYKMPPTTQSYTNGRSLYAYKHNTIQIDMETRRFRYPLTQDGKSGIDSNNIIFGFRFPTFTYQTPDSLLQPSFQAKGSTFFTLQAGRENILEKFPINELYAHKALQMPFFPIEPLLAGAIDWQSSEFIVSDATRPETGTALLMQVFYYEPEN